ncbi:glycosyltransferase, partial [Enterobacter asburiae]
ISQLDRSALRAEAREFFGLDPQAPVLLEFGGSQGAQSLNRVMNEAVSGLAEKNIGVLQAVGPKNYDCGDPTRGGAPAGA